MMDVREKQSSEKRLIDANALGIGRCCKNILPPDYCAGWNGVINLIEKAPTIDAVPVIRCRECKYHNKPPCPMRLSFNWTEDNDFCSYGERKDGDDDG